MNYNYLSRPIFVASIVFVISFLGAETKAEDDSIQTTINNIVERKVSFSLNEKTQKILDSIDKISKDPAYNKAERYRAALASYEVKSYLQLNAEALESAKTALGCTSTDEERAFAARAAASILLQNPQLAQSEAEVREYCGNAILELNKYLESAKKLIPVEKMVDGEKRFVILDPYKFIFLQTDLLIGYSDYLANLHDYKGAWENSKASMSLLGLYPDRIPESYRVSINTRYFNRSIQVKDYNEAAKTLVDSFENKITTKQTTLALLAQLVKAMVDTKSLSAPEFVPANFPIAKNAMLTLIFKSIAARTYYDNGDYLTALDLTKNNLDAVSKYLDDILKHGDKAPVDEIQKTQIEMLELLDACYIKTDNLTAAKAVGDAIRSLKNQNPKQ
jgi:hypothetical protein